MPFNGNDAEPQKDFELMPDGAMVRVGMEIRIPDSGKQVPGQMANHLQTMGLDNDDIQWLTQSQSSDAVMLSCELTVIGGQYSGRKFWENIVFEGGKRDDNGNSIAGNISKQKLRAMLEAARGIQPSDMSPAACQARNASFRDFHGLEFPVKIKLEPAKGNYGAKNVIKSILTPDKKEYQAVMSGQAVQPETKTAPSAPAQPQPQPAAPQPMAAAAAAPEPPANNGVPAPPWASGPAPAPTGPDSDIPF